MVLAETIDRLRKPLDQALRPRSREDQELLDLSTKCVTTADELLEELRRIQSDTRGGIRQAFKNSFRALRKKDFIKKTQETLYSYQNILHTRLLLRLDGRSVEQREDFSTLDRTLQDLVMAVNQGPNAVEKLLSNNNRSLHDHIDQRFDNAAQIDRNSKLQQQFMDSLFFPEIHVREEQISDEHQGTCQWIFRSQEDWSLEADTKSWPNFVDWLKNGHGLYWINGKAGSGKSTLMNFIIHESKTDDALDTWANGSTLLRPSFFFWNSGTGLQKSYAGLLRSLIYQIASKGQDLISILTDADMEFQKAASDPLRSLQIPTWTERRLSNILIQFLENKPSSLSICFFIDGLDEFEGDRDTLIELLRSITNMDQTKVCFTSRPEQIFRHEFRHVPHLRLQDLNSRDIKKTAEDKIGPVLEKYARAESDVHYLIERIVRYSQGVFLWLDIVIKDIINGARNMDTFDEIQSRLYKTPDTIEGLYENMLKRLDHRYVSDAIKYFSMLKLTNDPDSRSRSLTLLDFVLAETVPWERALENDVSYFHSPGFDDACSTLETRILTRCAGLVEIAQYARKYLDVKWEGRPSFSDIRIRSNQEGNISRHSRTVSFIHRTAHDFLKDHRKHWFLKLKATRVSLARCWIGSISLLPMTITEKLKPGQWFRIDRFDHGLMTVASAQNFPEPGEFDRTLHRTAIGMVDHAYQIVSRVDATLNGSNIEWYKRYTESDFGHHKITNLPFHDCAGFAAFLGCTPSVFHHLWKCRYEIVFKQDPKSECDLDFEHGLVFKKPSESEHYPESEASLVVKYDPASENDSESEGDLQREHDSESQHNPKSTHNSKSEHDLQIPNYLLACTLHGMICRTEHVEFWIESLKFLVERLLDLGADPNIKMFEDDTIDLMYDKFSAWGVAFCMTVISIHGASHGIQHDEIAMALWEKRKHTFISWIDIFLSHGADIDTTTFWRWATHDNRGSVNFFEKDSTPLYLECHGDIHFLIEDSILSYLESYTFESPHARRFVGIILMNLRSRGAKSTRVCVRIYERLLDWSSVFYRLSQEQSKYLLDSSHNDIEIARRVFNEMRERLKPDFTDKNAFWSLENLTDESEPPQT